MILELCLQLSQLAVEARNLLRVEDGGKLAQIGLDQRLLVSEQHCLADGRAKGLRLAKPVVRSCQIPQDPRLRGGAPFQIRNRPKALTGPAFQTAPDLRPYCCPGP